MPERAKYDLSAPKLLQKFRILELRGVTHSRHLLLGGANRRGEWKSGCGALLVTSDVSRQLLDLKAACLRIG